MNRIVFALGAAVALASLAGCEENRDAHEAVKAQLEEPGSAQFAQEAATRDGKGICGLVTAKSRAGTAPTPFLYQDGRAQLGPQPPDTSDLRRVIAAAESDAEFVKQYTDINGRCVIIANIQKQCPGNISTALKPHAFCDLWTSFAGNTSALQALMQRGELQ